MLLRFGFSNNLLVRLMDDPVLLVETIGNFVAPLLMWLLGNCCPNKNKQSNTPLQGS